MGTKIAILGAGPGGYVAAVRAAQRGAEVTLIEEDNPGGTCLNRGCIPTKVLVTTATIFEKLKQANTLGIDIHAQVSLNMPRLMARKEKIVADQRDGVLKLLKHHRIRYLRGTGYIKSKGLMGVSLSEGGEEEVAWDKLILATGSRPLELNGMPFDGQLILSSDHALELREVPESILIIGGGVIGCEFAFIFSALGSRVIIVEALSRMLPLPWVDEDSSKVLQREMKKRKISFFVNKVVEGFSQEDDKLKVSIAPSPFLDNPTEKDKKPVIETVDKILVCTGRIPNSTSVKGLDLLDVQVDQKGWVIANELMETSEPDVYAIGDVLGPSKVMLAHVASTEGMVAAENATGGNRIMDYNAVPSAVFTSPEIASVGLTEAQAVEQGLDVRADSVLFRILGKAQVIGEIAGHAKIVSEKSTGKVLGVHIIGPHATDLIAEGTLAVRTGCTVTELAETIHAHPTLPEIMFEASLKAVGMSLHG